MVVLQMAQSVISYGAKAAAENIPALRYNVYHFWKAKIRLHVAFVILNSPRIKPQ